MAPPPVGKTISARNKEHDGTVSQTIRSGRICADEAPGTICGVGPSGGVETTRHRRNGRSDTQDIDRITVAMESAEGTAAVSRATDAGRGMSGMACRLTWRTAVVPSSSIVRAMISPLIP